MKTVWARVLRKSGILFLIALESRDYVTITYGGGITAFTDYRVEQMEDAIVPMLSDGDYIGAAQTYLELCDKTLAFYAQKGEPWDRENDPTQLGKRLLFKIAIVVLLPLLIAGTVCFLFYRQMKTAVQKNRSG